MPLRDRLAFVAAALITCSTTAQIPSSYTEIGHVQPRHASDIASSRWSVGAETMDRDYTIYDNWKSYLGPLGVKRARIQAGWAKTETRLGVYDWTWLDRIIPDIAAQGVEPWVNLAYGNPLYDGGGGTSLNGGFPEPRAGERGTSLILPPPATPVPARGPREAGGSTAFAARCPLAENRVRRQGKRRRHAVRRLDASFPKPGSQGIDTVPRSAGRRRGCPAVAGDTSWCNTMIKPTTRDRRRLTHSPREARKGADGSPLVPPDHDHRVWVRPVCRR